MSMTRQVTYCSFAADRFLGAVVLEGVHCPVQASVICHAAGINPGGQLMAVSCAETDVDVPAEIFEAMWASRGRLLTEDEARTLFEAKSMGELKAEDEARSRERGPCCPKCGGTNLYDGFGLAGGGYGGYRGCDDCDWFEKDQCDD